MKKLMILLATSAITLAASAQSDIAKNSKKEIRKEEKAEKKEERKELRKLEGPNVSFQAKEQFESDFSDATNVSWKRDKAFDIANFDQNGIHKTAYYDAGPQLVGTVMAKSFSDLPKSAQNYINKHYALYKRGNTIMFDDNEENDTDMILYGTQFDDADSYFTEFQKGNTYIVLRTTPEGNVSLFSEIKEK